jgi:uncharacterized repeat protein (TIGR04076 family)
MAANYKINCEIVKVDTESGYCPGSAKSRLGETYIIGPRTPSPGMCCRAFQSIHPMALAMRFSDEILCEKPEGQVEVTCPDGFVVFRLSRITKDETA